jgi:hypothetical protein
MALIGGGCSGRYSVVVSDHVDQWDLPEVDVQVMPAMEDSPFGDSDDGVVGIIDVDCFLVKDCDVVCVSVFSCAEEGMLNDPEVMWSSFAVDLTLNRYSAISVAGMTLPLGRMNCNELLVEWLPGVMARICCGTHTRIGSTVCYCGGNSSV